jgi:septal ring factor EnvC (AmiA/AmiB activator)
MNSPLSSPMMAIDLPAIGGMTGFAAACVYAFTQLLDWLDKRRAGELDERSTDITEKTASVTDAATANAVILKTLDAVHAENDRLRQSVASKDAEIARKDARIDELQQQLREAAEKIAKIYTELESMRSKHSPKGRE